LHFIKLGDKNIILLPPKNIPLCIFHALVACGLNIVGTQPGCSELPVSAYIPGIFNLMYALINLNRTLPEDKASIIKQGIMLVHTVFIMILNQARLSTYRRGIEGSLFLGSSHNNLNVKEKSLMCLNIKESYVI
jgi:hypothetical protein